MFKYCLALSLMVSACLIGCIGTDIINDRVDPQLEITTDSERDTIVVDTDFQLEVKYTNIQGLPEDVDINWVSRNPSVASVNQNGLVSAVATGSTVIVASFEVEDFLLKDSFIISVVLEVDPEVIITEFVDTLGIDDSFQFKAAYYNSNGLEEAVELVWESSDPSKASVNSSGLVTGKQMGNSTISVSYDNGVESIQANRNIIIEEETVVMLEQRSGRISTTSSYDLTGDFTLTEEENGTLTLSFSNNYDADAGLPGLYVYLTNNRNSNSPSVSYEIGAVTTFNGSHSYTLPASIGIDQYEYVLYYCKPFSVKVGDGRIN